MPLRSIGIYVPATGTGFDLRNASVAIVDEDRSQLSARIADAFLEPYFQAIQYLPIDEIDRVMDAGRYTFVIDIPPNYQADVLAGPAFASPRGRSWSNGGGVVSHVAFWSLL